MLGRTAPIGRPPPPEAEMLNRDGLEEATIGVCFVGAIDAREEGALDPREFSDALETVASVVRRRAAMMRLALGDG